MLSYRIRYLVRKCTVATYLREKRLPVGRLRNYECLSARPDIIVGIKKLNQCYKWLERFSVGKSHLCLALCKCCNWSHFRQTFKFLAFFHKSWFFLLLFCVKTKKINTKKPISNKLLRIKWLILSLYLTAADPVIRKKMSFARIVSSTLSKAIHQLKQCNNSCLDKAAC